MTIFALMLAVSTAAQGSAADALESELRTKYPGVVRWEIDALDAARAARVARETGPVTVVRLGARSAVAVDDRHLLWFAVRGYRNVVVAVRSLAARSDAAEADFVLEERDVLGLPCAPLVDLTGVAGTWTRRSVRAGDVLCGDSLEPKPPVVRGAQVSVVYSTPRIRVVSTARAEKDAKLGERLPVRNPATGEIYFAVATGRNEVAAHDQSR
jgi:flagella basal body P-ring formation protein FlgA